MSKDGHHLQFTYDGSSSVFPPPSLATTACVCPWWAPLPLLLRRDDAGVLSSIAATADPSSWKRTCRSPAFASEVPSSSGSGPGRFFSSPVFTYLSWLRPKMYSAPWFLFIRFCSAVLP